MINMGGSTLHTQTVLGVAWLAELDFTGGTVYITSAPQSISINTGTGFHTYVGLGALANVANLNEGPDASAEKITLSLSLVDSAMVALALGSVEGYRGKAVRLFLVLLSTDFTISSNALLRWSGVMDRVSITRKNIDPQSPGAAGGSIDLQCSRAGMARARHYQGLRLTLQQQQTRYPGDTGLQYVRTLIEKPAQWLSKRFQEV